MCRAARAVDSPWWERSCSARRRAAASPDERYRAPVRRPHRRGEAGLSQLSESVATLEGSAARLEHARSLFLRRRAATRGPSQRSARKPAARNGPRGPELRRHARAHRTRGTDRRRRPLAAPARQRHPGAHRQRAPHRHHGRQRDDQERNRPSTVQHPQRPSKSTSPAHTPSSASLAAQPSPPRSAIPTENRVAKRNLPPVRR